MPCHWQYAPTKGTVFISVNRQTHRDLLSAGHLSRCPVPLTLTTPAAITTTVPETIFSPDTVSGHERSFANGVPVTIAGIIANPRANTGSGTETVPGEAIDPVAYPGKIVELATGPGKVVNLITGSKVVASASRNTIAASTKIHEIVVLRLI